MRLSLPQPLAAPQGRDQPGEDGLQTPLLPYRLPAEWEPQEATWLIWPDQAAMVPHWHGHEAELRSFYPSLIAQIERFEQLHLIRAETLQPAAIASADPLGSLPWVGIDSDDIWLRDTAPTFLIPSRNNGQQASPAPLRAICGRWQAYGGNYSPSRRDAQLAVRFASHLRCQQVNMPLVLEGGAFDTDGMGTLLASQRSIVCEKRNPGLSRSQLEELIQAHLGVSHVLWIDGCLQGDDTDGHVDQLARFVAPGRVLVAHQPDPLDGDHAMLQRLQQQLRSCRDARDRQLEIIPIDLPAPQSIGARRLAASYLNFYIGNRAVYLPSFGCPSDHQAATILGRCFPGRRIIPIDCRVIIRGGGALHCISRQQPALAARQQLCNNSSGQCL